MKSVMGFIPMVLLAFVMGGCSQSAMSESGNSRLPGFVKEGGKYRMNVSFGPSGEYAVIDIDHGWTKLKPTRGGESIWVNNSSIMMIGE